MYVTDTPVMDRLADPAVREIDAATEALETALSDLDGWIEEAVHHAGRTAPGAREYFGTPPALAEIHKGLSEAHSRALSAFGHVMDALDLANLPTL